MDCLLSTPSIKAQSNNHNKNIIQNNNYRDHNKTKKITTIKTKNITVIKLYLLHSNRCSKAFIEEQVCNCCKNIDFVFCLFAFAKIHWKKTNKTWKINYFFLLVEMSLCSTTYLYSNFKCFLTLNKKNCFSLACFVLTYRIMQIRGENISAIQISNKLLLTSSSFLVLGKLLWNLLIVVCCEIE